MLANSTDIINRLIDNIVQPAVLLLFSAALLVFFWGVLEFIRNADDSKGRESGRRHMIWGIIGLFIMVGSYGILDIIINTFGLNAQPTLNSIQKNNNAPSFKNSTP